jgi:hypothetical protein
MTVGDVWMASFVHADNQRQQWRRPGERMGEFMVLMVEAEGVTLLDARGARHVVRLPEATIVDRGLPPADFDEWQRWVNSRDNPMLHQPADLPVDARRWLELPAERHRQIAGWYVAHGWQLSVAPDGHGGVAIDFAPLQGEQRQAILAQKQQAFLQALSPGQRTLYVAMRRGAEHPGVFETSLQPRQRDAYRLLGDFTQSP